MSYDISIKRKIDIFDEEIQKIFNISEIKEHIKEGNIQLYSFTIDDIIYTEYIKKIEYFNGNSEDYLISIYNSLNNKPKTKIYFLYTGLECPKCHGNNILMIDKDCFCQNTDCKFKGEEKDFLFD